MKNISIQRTKEKTLFNQSLKWGTILFLAVALVGTMISVSVKNTTEMGNFISSRDRFDFSALKDIKISTGTLKLIGTLSIFSMGLIFISSIFNLYFMFKIRTISPITVNVALTLFVIADGTGFGLLFLTMNAVELMAIFGIAGGIFGAIWLSTYFIKSMSWAMPVLIVGMGITLVLSILSISLYAAGVYDDKLILFMNIFSGMLTVLWIMWELWYIRRMSEWMDWESMSERDKYVYPRFFGYRLASDMIGLIWRIAYFMMRMYNG